MVYSKTQGNSAKGSANSKIYLNKKIQEQIIRYDKFDYSSFFLLFLNIMRNTYICDLNQLNISKEAKTQTFYESRITYFRRMWLMMICFQQTIIGNKTLKTICFKMIQLHGILGLYQNLLRSITLGSHTCFL